MGREDGAHIKELLPRVDCDIPMPKIKLPKGVDVANQPHYTQGTIQHIDYVVAQGWFENSACVDIHKYITRWQHKGGAQDLRKARQYLDWLINLVETGDIYRGERSTK